MTTKHSIWNKFLRPAAGLALLLILIACTPEMLSKIESATPASVAAAATPLPGQDNGISPASIESQPTPTSPASIESQLTPTSTPPAYLAKRGVGIPTNGAPLPPVPIPANMWFYDWGATSANLANPYYLPMSFNGEDRIPAGYTGTILVFNEPDNSGQANLTPVKAAAAYKAFRTNHAPARLCVGGTTLLRSVNWLTAFIAELNRQNIPLPTCVHMHSYIEGDLTVSNAQQIITSVHNLTGATLMVTEFNDALARLENVQAIIAWFEETPWIEKYFIFTTQVGGSETWWPSWWDMHMNLYYEGKLTPIGELYFSGFPYFRTHPHRSE